ncbi:MAG: mechanosensitive ion channel [Bacteroidia bacterium]|nr:mechanosensitive ion channel [Bacteroidia bacterium]
MKFIQELEIPVESLWALASSIAFGIVTLLVGLAVIRYLVNMSDRIMKRREVDPSLIPFLRSLLSIALKIGLVLTVMEVVGLQATSFIAILGAAGLAIGMALSGTLQNFAGGVMILLFKPFKVGDYISAQGQSGTVKEIQIFNTILKTPDNVTIIIPNGGLSTGTMTNYSMEERRRVDFTFGIAYGEDVDKARGVLRSIMDADARVLQDPEPFIKVGALADSSVNFTVRIWTLASDYWAVHFDINEKVYKEFHLAGINIPFPQMDVHVHNG